MVAERLTEAELAANLPELLDRVRKVERFDFEQVGEIIAEFEPPIQEQGKISWDIDVGEATLSRLQR
jgi:hypothetical protein